MLLALSSGATASTNYQMPSGAGPGQHALNLVDEFIFATSRLVGVDRPPAGSAEGRSWDETLCETSFDAECVYRNNDHSVRATMVIPACDQDDSSDCIESLRIEDDDGFRTAEYLGEADGPTYEANPKTGLPAGRTTSLWKVEGDASSQSPKTYAVHGALELNLWPPGKFRYDRINLAVVPYEVKSGTYQAPSNFEETGSDGVRRVLYTGFSTQCAWVKTSECGEFKAFDPDTKISLTLKLSKNLSGWLFGRLIEPEIDVTSIDREYSRVEITGKPMSIPKIFGVFDLENPPQEVLDYFGVRYPKREGTTSALASQLQSELIEAFKVIASDTSIGDYQSWSFGSVNGGKCIEPGAGLQGMVTTNASAYQSGAPTYSNGLLQYRVGGLHFASDGVTPNVGTYDLQIRMDVAKCLYGISKAPTSAVVTVTGVGESTNVATAVVREREGWLSLEARGFTFSEKTISVDLNSKTKVSSTIAAFSNRSTMLSSRQKAQIRSSLDKVAGVQKIICTGVHSATRDALLARKRAKATCDYVRQLRPDLGVWYQSKKSNASSFDGKVLLRSKP